MPESQDGYWFVPHAFGIGATPVTWQGWALTIGFVALSMLAVTKLPNRVAQTGVLVALILLFTLIAIRKTRGGWRWRWGGRG
ncbi:hypothetical protein ABIC16_000194 [Sphingomonas sp. PvP055]|uniref:hypothetical protein n=1 Tax=Sphingomonas sp. PvP055 TaxID=3156391 RepID=UPI00339999C7